LVDLFELTCDVCSSLQTSMGSDLVLQKDIVLYTSNPCFSYGQP